MQKLLGGSGACSLSIRWAYKTRSDTGAFDFMTVYRPICDLTTMILSAPIIHMCTCTGGACPLVVRAHAWLHHWTWLVDWHWKSSSNETHMPVGVNTWCIILPPKQPSSSTDQSHRHPPFDLQKILYTPHFMCPTVWKWSTSLAAIENHRCPNESGCSYASLFVEDQRWMRTEAVYTTAMKGRV